MSDIMLRDPDISQKEEEDPEENTNYIINDSNDNIEMTENIPILNNTNNDNNNNNINVKELLQKHDKVLSESKATVLYFILCALFTSFLRSSRTNVWILYARVFYLETSSNIAWVLYGGTMFSGLSALFYSSVADYIGYDRMMCIILCLKCIGVLLECIGIDFSLLIIGYLLTSLAIIYVCLSYISWILPHKYAVLYTSYFYAAYFLSYLSGAMIGSILSYYFNYRLIFWVNFAFMLAIFIFSIYFIIGIQNKLEKKQLKIGKKLYKIIPLKLKTANHQQNTFENREHPDPDPQIIQNINDDDEIDINNTKLKDINERFSCVVNHESNQRKLNASYFDMRSMTCMHWILLICVLIQHSMVLCVDALWILYYNVYVIDKFHSTVLIGASQIVVVCVSFALGNLIIPSALTSNFLNIKNNKYLVILCCSLILILMFGCAYPLTNNVDIFWCYAVITGFVSGILSMTLEIIVLELQPKEYTGRINGIKGFTRFFVTANGVLIAGLLWDITYNSMFYTQAGAHCLVLLFILFMFSIQIYQRKHNSPNNHTGDQIRISQIDNQETENLLY